MISSARNTMTLIKTATNTGIHPIKQGGVNTITTVKCTVVGSWVRRRLSPHTQSMNSIFTTSNVGHAMTF